MNWYDGRLAAFDIESTGTDTGSDRIVTAAISVVGGGEDSVSCDWLVDPGIEIPAEATAVHRVTTEMARAEGRPAAEAIDEITGALAEQLGDGIPIVAFNARFDLTMLDREARRHGVEPLVDRVGGPDGLLVVDPYVIDKQCNRFRSGRRTLGVLCEAYGIPLTDAHAADADALAAARLAWVLARRNPEIGEADIFDLYESQIEWAATQAAELQEYFASKGRIETIEGAWPIVPPQAGISSLEPLAA